MRVPMPHGGFRVVSPPLISDESVIEAYQRLQSVWAAGRELGMAGQTVHKRLRKAGFSPNKIRTLSQTESGEIRRYYADTPADKFSLSDLSKKIGRTRQSISRYAGKMGLTKHRPHNAEVRARQGRAMSEKWRRQPHPRGALGMVHSPEAIAKMSAASKRTWALSKTFGIIHMAPKARDARSLSCAKRAALSPSFKNYTRGRGGRREDLGETWFRSSWEANYARYLNLLVRMKIVTEWHYEPETFWFEGVRRGCVSYRPDFRVIYRNDLVPEYVEIKGWTTAKDRTKWKRMKKYHPTIKLVVVAVKEYREIQNRWRGSIPEWEAGAERKAAATRLLGKEANLQ